MTFQVPSLKELNELSASDASLLLLRVLNTSDLSFFHSLFKKETLEDILSVTDDMVRMEMEEGLFPNSTGYLAEREQIQDEIDMQRDNPHMNKHELRIAEMESEAEKEDPEHIDGKSAF